MGVNLMTGYAGTPHVTSADDGAWNAGMYGDGKYVLDVGLKFAYELISNNLIRIKDGYAVNQGRKIGLAFSEYVECIIETGLQGVKRSDLIVLRYNKNMDSGIETASFEVIKGISGDDYVDPEYTSGNILEGGTVDDMPLYRVKLNGLSIEAVENMFETCESMLTRLNDLEEDVDELNFNISKDLITLPHTLLTGNICNTVTGSYEYTSIPNLSKYQEVLVRYRIGDAKAALGVRIIKGINERITDCAYLSATYNGRINIHVDFSNNQIGIYTIAKTGWDYQYLSITGVYGLRLV